MIESVDISDLKSFLDEKANYYNHVRFIETDPLQVPHRYALKEDIEIAGFLAATIAWGNRKSIIASADKMMAFLGNSPYDFVMSHRTADLEKLSGFVHRTFNGTDLQAFVRCLRHVYEHHGGLEAAFSIGLSESSMQPAISNFKKLFFEQEPLLRAQKHVSDPERNSAAKRINMFLRWMVRNDNRGVDLGIWKSIPMPALSCPVDVHSGNIARKLGLLSRQQNDAKAVAELDTVLRSFDASDPAKYDFALFGLGAFEKF